MPKPRSIDNRRENFLHHRGDLLVLFVVVISLGVSMLAAGNSSWLFLLSVLAIGSLYIALFIFVGDRVSQGIGLATYFVVQLLLFATLSSLFARQGSFAVEWVICMPLISQARMQLRPWGTALVSVSCLAVMAAHVYILSSWRHVPGTLAGVSTAVVFVLAFTDLAVREASARQESQRLGKELEDANHQLADYALQAEELATVRERGRVAHEIHDSLGHVLSALNMQLEAARATFERDPPTSLDALDKAQGLARQGLSEIRRSVAALTTSPLDGRPLDDALAELVAQNTEAGMTTGLRVEGEPRPLGSRADLTLYRTVQEGLTNARKHSRAQQVDVLLDYRSHETFRLKLSDDGVGAEGLQTGFGLLGVQERVRQVDGHCQISTAPGSGFVLEVEIPA